MSGANPLSQLGPFWRDREFWRDVGRNTQQVAGGLTAGALGAPVDIASAVVRPFAQLSGYSMPPESVVGSSDWFGKKMGHDTGSIPWMAGSIGPVPDGVDAARLAGSLDKLGPLASLGMTAFHGTPHRFPPEPGAPLGRFKLEKIGTGEGAQAYGHGIYVAESKDVAGTYKRQLSDTVEVPDGTPHLEKRIAQMAVTFGNDDPVKWLSKFFDKQADHLSPALTPELARRVASKFDAGEFRPGGHVYKVDLPDTEIEKMLDWDKPLDDDLVRRVAKKSTDDGIFDGDIDEAVELIQDFTGGGRNGRLLYEGLVEQLGSQQAASGFLRELGIPGIRYLDGTSRKAGEGTRNFVLFDPDVAKIIGVE